MIDEWQEKQTKLDYAVDGLVVKVNSIAAQNKLGSTAKHPRWAAAFKYEAEEAETVVQDIRVQVGRTGSITPVAELDAGIGLRLYSQPGDSAQRGRECKRLDVRVGDRVVIIQGGRDHSESRARVEGPGPKRPQTEIQNAENLPRVRLQSSSGPEGEAVWRCVNAACPAQLKERLLHFASRNAMDIDHLGTATCRSAGRYR